MIKHFFIAVLFLGLGYTGFAKTETDTITTWQLYKDAALILKNNSADKTITLKIKASDTFKALKLTISSDTPTRNVRRKLMFKIDGKLIFSLVQELRSGSDPIIITNAELKRIIGPGLNKTFTVEYTDDTTTRGTTLYKLMVTDK